MLLPNVSSELVSPVVVMVVVAVVRAGLRSRRRGRRRAGAWTMAPPPPALLRQQPGHWVAESRGSSSPPYAGQ